VVRSPLDPFVQILKPKLEVRLVVLPRHTIHPGRGLARERVECRPECIDIDVVEAHDDHVAGSLALSPALGPQIEDIVQVDIGPGAAKSPTLDPFPCHLP